MKKTLGVVSLSALALSLAACGGSAESRRQKIINREVGKMPAPTKSLGDYGRFELMPTGTTPQVNEDERKVKVVEDFGARAQSRLQQLIQTWAATSSQDTLQIQVVVTSVRIVSGGARFWAGALAGNSHIEVDLIMTDKASGQVVGQPHIRLESGGMAGAWSYGSADRNLIEYALDVIYTYLQRNHPSYQPPAPAK